MKLEITEKGSNNYYDEFLFLTQNYKKINSSTKIKKMTDVALKYLITSLLIFILFLGIYLKFKEPIQLGIMIFFSLLILISIIYLILIKQNINKLASSFLKTKFEINNEFIRIENEKEKYELKFTEIKKILVGNYAIFFIPKNDTSKFISTRIEYKGEILKVLKKYEKENLVI